MMDFSVVGDINMDVVPRPVPEEIDIREDGQVFTENIEYRRGGQAANLAVKLSELGEDVRFHGKLGEDRNGDFLLEHLKEEGVEPAVNRSDEVKTGTTLVVSWETGKRHFISHIENNASLCLEDLDMENIVEKGHLARRGVWFSEPMLDGGNQRLLEEASRRGVETSIDLHWDPYWNEDRTAEADRRRSKFLEAVEEADFLMGNEEEIKNLAKKSDLVEALEKISRFGNPKIVVHRGEDGSLVYSGETLRIPVETVENPVNPTGAGDAYDAGFLKAWRDGKGLEESAEFATEVAVEHLKGEE